MKKTLKLIIPVVMAFAVAMAVPYLRTPGGCSYQAPLILFGSVLGCSQSKQPEPESSAAVVSTDDAASAADASADKNTGPVEHRVTFVEIGSVNCIPCKMMQPILAELTAEYEGQMTVKFIDVYENSSVAEKYKIRGIPTQIFFDAEGKEISRNVGFIPKDEILARWKSLGYEFKKNPSSEKQDK